MRLTKARVQNYRSIIDSGEFEIEQLKSIFVGPNEAGKTVLLKALQQLSKPTDIEEFDVLRDYPRSKYDDITTKKVTPSKVTVVTGIFELESEDKELIPEEFHGCKYKMWRCYDNKGYHRLVDAPEEINFEKVKKNFLRMASHMDKQFTNGEPDEESVKPSESLKLLTEKLPDSRIISAEVADSLKGWLDKFYEFVEEDNEKEEARHSELLEIIRFNSKSDEVLATLGERIPVFILFNNYFRVKPLIHLGHLAQRTEQNIIDDKYYDYGNLCLLKLLGFTARKLSDLGSMPSPDINDHDALQNYKDNLDKRSYQLNAASIKLTNEIRSVWFPNPERPEADKLKVVVDGQYLKVVVEDDLGVDIELDQRSEGFQWLVSFFVVFFSET